LSAAADSVKAASFSVGRSAPAKALFTRAMGRKRPRASSHGRKETQVDRRTICCMRT
jgi:hypothetical protein